MSLFARLGNLFDECVDAIVVPAPINLKLEGNVGGQAAFILGKEFQEEALRHAPVSYTNCVSLKVKNDCLQYKNVILTVNPKFIKGQDLENEKLLIKSYVNIFEKALELGFKSVAFPLLSSGAYSFKKTTAIDCALCAMNKYKDKNIDLYLIFNNANSFYGNKDLIDGFNITRLIMGQVNQDNKERDCGRAESFQWITKNIFDASQKDSSYFPKKIEYLRVSRCWSITELIEGVCTRPMYDKYLKGDNMPSLKTLYLFAAKLQLEIGELMEFLSSAKSEGDIIFDKEINDCLIQKVNFDIAKKIIEEKFPNNKI